MPSTFDFSERYGTRAGGYRDLMSHQVRHVVLVSSLYESFTLAEDGHLHERVLGRFLEASPREPPDLTRVSAGREALKLLRSGGRRAPRPSRSASILGNHCGRWIVLHAHVRLGR